MDQEVYEGLLLAVVATSVKKVKAGLRHAASGKHQDYPAGILELGVVLDGIDMIEKDILHFIEINAEPQSALTHIAADPLTAGAQDGDIDDIWKSAHSLAP